MLKKIGMIGAAVAVLAAVAVGSAAIAGAAQDGSSRGERGDHGGHKAETPLTGTTATKVEKAALAKVKGGSIIRVETDSDSESPYEAHVNKSDGSQVVVLVDKTFKATAVNGLPGN